MLQSEISQCSCYTRMSESHLLTKLFAYCANHFSIASSIDDVGMWTGKRYLRNRRAVLEYVINFDKCAL